MSFGITVKMTNLLSVKVQVEPFVVNAIKKRKWSFKTPRSGIFLEISYPRPSPTPPICFLFWNIFALNKHQVSNKCCSPKHCIYGHLH